MGISKNSGTPKWMVKTRENPIRMDDLGGKQPLFLVQHPYYSLPNFLGSPKNWSYLLLYFLVPGYRNTNPTKTASKSKENGQEVFLKEGVWFSFVLAIWCIFYPNEPSKVWKRFQEILSKRWGIIKSNCSFQCLHPWLEPLNTQVQISESEISRACFKRNTKARNRPPIKKHKIMISRRIVDDRNLINHQINASKKGLHILCDQRSLKCPRQPLGNTGSGETLSVMYSNWFRPKPNASHHPGGWLSFFKS